MFATSPEIALNGWSLKEVDEFKKKKKVNIGALELSRGNLNNSATNTTLGCSHTRVCERLCLLIVGVLVHETAKP